MKDEVMKVGVLSDTHGLLRPRVLEVFEGCERILHAGDVGDAEILTELGKLAPVEAVRGNMDLDGAVAALPFAVAGELGGLPYHMVHRREDIEEAWLREARLVIFGHSHRPELEWRGSCLLLNPGACGRRRFHQPLTVAVLTVGDGRLVPEIRAAAPW